MPNKRILTITILIIFTVLTTHYTGTLNTLELKAYNWHFTARGPNTISKDIIIVAIDDESLGWLGSWPWSRKYHATLIKVLENAGAKLIGFDILFDSPTSLQDGGDTALQEAIQTAKVPVILTSMHVVNQQGVEINRPPISKFIKKANYGYAEAHVDQDGFIRKLSPTKAFQGQDLDSFTAKIVKALEGYPQAKLANTTLSIGQYNIALNKQKHMLINYSGPANWVKTVPFDRVVDRSILKRQPNLFRNKIVLVGATSVILQDLFYTPFFDYGGKKQQMPGVEIRANELSTILENKYINNAPLLPTLIILFLLISTLVLIFYKLRSLASLGVAFITTAVVLASSVYSFINLFSWFELGVPSILGIWLSFLIVTIDRFIQEEKEKQRIRGVFSRYVAPNVVNELLQNRDSLNLGGERKNLSIFFSDIRSFTTFSENRTPEEVVSMLNEYLTAMTEIIFKYGGTLDKYVGDEIMAIWGAPLDQEDHALRAVLSSIEQIQTLKSMQQKWIAEGKQPLDIGIGINTGQMVIGNIGSPIHMDYTVIGDTVNCAARLEAETRNHGTDTKPCHIIISETTHAIVKDQVQTKPLGEVLVKGKNIPVKIYEVVVE